MPKRITLGQIKEFADQADKELITRQDLQKLIQKGRKLALTRLLDKIIEKIMEIAVDLPNDYQKARQLVRALEITEFGTSSRYSVANELTEACKNLEPWQEIEIEARRAALGVLTPKSLAFEQLWEKVSTIPDSFRRTEAAITIAMNSEDTKYCKAADGAFLALIPKMKHYDLESLRYKLVLTFLKVNDLEHAEQLAVKIGDQGTKDTALTEIAIALVLERKSDKAEKLAEGIKHPFGRTRIFLTLYNALCKEGYLKEAEKAMAEIHIPFFRIRALAELAKVKSVIPFEERIKIVPRMKELIPETRDIKERIEALTSIALVSRRERDFRRALETVPKISDFNELDFLLIVAASIQKTMK